MASSEGEETLLEDKSCVCSFCLKNAGRYTCPRCNQRYCSAACYKGERHMECSEAFYKDCFMEGLKDMEASSEDKHKVKEMLQRLENQDSPLPDSDDDSSGEEEEEDELEQRMLGLNLDKDTDKIWEKLTSSEKREFQEMLEDGRLGHLVELWEPWWKAKRQSLVEEVASHTPNPTTTHPKIMKDIQDINVILKNAAPSDHIPYTAVNVLYGYAYIARLRNGDYMEVAEQAVQDLLSISDGLAAASFSSVSEAIHGCLQSLHKEDDSLLISQEFSVAVIEDVRCMLESDHSASPLRYTLAALSDIQHMMRVARKAIEKDLKEMKEKNKKNGMAKLKDRRQKCFSALKKVEFLLSWTVKYGKHLTDCVPHLELEFCALSSELTSHQRDRQRLEKHWGGKRPRNTSRFIEDITDTHR